MIEETYGHGRRNDECATIRVVVEDWSGFLYEHQMRHDVGRPALVPCSVNWHQHGGFVTDLVPFIVAQIMKVSERGEPSPAGIVDDNIEAAELFNAFLH